MAIDERNYFGTTTQFGDDHETLAGYLPETIAFMTQASDVLSEMAEHEKVPMGSAQSVPPQMRYETRLKAADLVTKARDSLLPVAAKPETPQAEGSIPAAAMRQSLKDDRDDLLALYQQYCTNGTFTNYAQALRLTRLAAKNLDVLLGSSRFRPDYLAAMRHELGRLKEN